MQLPRPARLTRVIAKHTLWRSQLAYGSGASWREYCAVLQSCDLRFMHLLEAAPKKGDSKRESSIAPGGVLVVAITRGA
eukprot:scaffold426941_cov17-Prasinocladus_malaysianus.AAC.1